MFLLLYIHYNKYNHNFIERGAGGWDRAWVGNGIGWEGIGMRGSLNMKAFKRNKNLSTRDLRSTKRWPCCWKNEEKQFHIENQNGKWWWCEKIYENWNKPAKGKFSVGHPRSNSSFNYGNSLNLKHVILSRELSIGEQETDKEPSGTKNRSGCWKGT